MLSSYLLLSSAPVISLVSLYAPHSRAPLIALPIAFSVSSPFLSHLYYCHLFPLITVTPPPSWALWTHWLPRLYSLCCCALTLFICMHRTLDYPSLAPPPLGALLRYFCYTTIAYIAPLICYILHNTPCTFCPSTTLSLCVRHRHFAYNIVTSQISFSHSSIIVIYNRTPPFFSCKRLSL